MLFDNLSIEGLPRSIAQLSERGSVPTEGLVGPGIVRFWRTLDLPSFVLVEVVAASFGFSSVVEEEVELQPIATMAASGTARKGVDRLMHFSC